MTEPLSGPLEHDEEGRELPQPDPHSDLADLIQLMEYARRRGFVVGPMVRIGKITVQIQDVRQREGQAGGEVPRPASIWEEHGFEDGQ